jgi:hypothetical protein
MKLNRDAGLITCVYMSFEDLETLFFEYSSVLTNLLDYALRLTKFEKMFEKMAIVWRILQYNLIRFDIVQSVVYIDLRFSKMGETCWKLEYPQNSILDLILNSSPLLIPNLDVSNFSLIIKVSF